MGFHPRLDFFLDPQNRHFALHQAVNLFQPLADAERLQKLLLPVNVDAQMARHQIGKFGRFAGLRDRVKRFFGDVFLDLGVAFKFFADRTQQGFDRFGLAWKFSQIFG